MELSLKFIPATGELQLREGCCRTISKVNIGEWLSESSNYFITSLQSQLTFATYDSETNLWTINQDVINNSIDQSVLTEIFNEIEQYVTSYFEENTTIIGDIVTTYLTENTEYFQSIITNLLTTNTEIFQQYFDNSVTSYFENNSSYIENIVNDYFTNNTTYIEDIVNNVFNNNTETFQQYFDNSVTSYFENNSTYIENIVNDYFTNNTTYVENVLTSIFNDNTQTFQQYFDNSVNSYFQDNSTYVENIVNDYFTNNTSYIENIVNNVFNDNTETFQQYFDNSVTNYFGANQSEVETIISNFLTTNTAYFEEIVSNLINNGTLDPLNTEQVQDIVGTMLYTTPSLAWTYDDSNGRIYANVRLQPFTTDDLREGTTNLYRRAGDAVDISGVFPINYNNVNGQISWAGTTTNVPEGTGLYFTNARARAAVSATGTILTYNQATGEFTVATDAYDNRYLQTETDPTVGSHIKAITTTNISNWNAAFGWGNHAGLYALINHTHDDRYVQLSGSYNNPTWLQSIDASKITTGTIDPARLPAAAAPIISSGGIADLTGPQQALVMAGTPIVITTDGSQWVYKGTGSKTDSANYIQLGVSVVSWAQVAGKPNTVSGFGITDVYTKTESDARYLTSFTETDPTVGSHIKAITTTNISNWNSAFGWGNHALAGYLTSYTETDPTVGSHIKAITTTNISNWNAAFGWGNHALAGYLTSYTETDPTVGSHIKAITTTNISNWNSAFGWGNHAGLYVPLARTLAVNGTTGEVNVAGGTQGLGTNVSWTVSLPSLHTGFTGGSATQVALPTVDAKGRITGMNYVNITFPAETDPTVGSHIKAITSTNISNWNSAFGWGNHALAGYLTSYTETDPTVGSHIKAITTTNISNWNTSFGWGNHAGLYVPLARTLAVNGTTGEVNVAGGTQALSANGSWTVSLPTLHTGFTGGSATQVALPTVDVKGRVTGMNYVNITFPSETDPTVGSHIKAITTTNISNWNTAFGWGNHAGLYVSGSGTANYVPKFSASTTLTNSIIFDNGSGVGIGTTDISTFKLRVGGAIYADGDGAGVAMYIGAGRAIRSAGGEMYFDSPGGNTYFRNGAGYAYSLTLTPSGYVLMGTVTPVGTRTLQVNGGIRATGQQQFANYTSATSYTGSTAGLIGFDSSGNLLTYEAVRTNAQNDAIYATIVHNHDANYYTKTQLNTSGLGAQVHWSNVTNTPGFLTFETDPTVPSFVKSISVGDIANWNAAYSWGNHAGLYALAGHNHDDRYYTEGEVNSLLSGKANTSHTHDDRYPVMWWNNGITGYWNFSSGLQVNGIDSADRFVVKSSGAGTQTVNNSMNVNGDFYCSGNVTAYSDAALKSNLSPIQDALRKIESIGGYNFTWNERSQRHGQMDIGVIAQEIEPYLPSIVRQMGQYKTVDYAKIVPLLIEGIKELSRQVKSLQK